MPKTVAKHYLPGWWHKRQERKARVAKVRARDGDNCWQCGNPMRFGAPYNVGKAATVEHHVPLSKGGTWALDNLRLCHVGCNRHLSNHSPEQKERMRLRTRELNPESYPG
jgi:5-methylcytosine-specific restriction endonuclease McrA